MTAYYPIMLNLQAQRIVVIGGGSIAAKKIAGLLESGAELVRVVSPQLSAPLQLLADRKEIQWLDQRYEPHLLEAATLVFAATDDAQLNEQISNDAKKYDILVCNVSEGQQGSFITPAIARSGELTAAISSAGSSPSLVKMMKQELEQHYLPRYANAQQLMKQLRAQVLRSNLSAEQRKKLLSDAAKEAMHVMDIPFEAWYASLVDRNVLDEGEDTEDGS
ncbi:precorrin-2 dehydrogenase/sirohydrochlorin ferrochelatase family protein [Paenibacillus camelliae]|uniref:precorrin-2 dehydrogenase/sirohydrochlorin ferrochelatase family protein n=1 Tax=Paenibacillus camelliae TaxID=512410 RepID=UPI002041E7EC|nr:bifunctional precorrin-2 dehydrogenase/sirohydrochlorin ferrochelatase [Paenibacillus camelliae]MCM3632461.1 bifunctional precorrin-2 dehydrogenase/sirohydrochlorin ferrochelatase [Paenibacillus camelliae]